MLSGLKNKQITYIPFYFTALIVMLVAFFGKKEILIYVKPLVPISLIIVYLTISTKKKFWYPLSMLFILVTDIMVYVDFLKYFNYIAITVTSFYLISSYLLKDYIKLSDIRISKLTVLPVLISVILLSYLIFSIADLVWDKIASSTGFFTMILLGVLLLVTICFFIFMADRYTKTIHVFIAGCCCLIVDALLGINELSFYNRIFTIIINLAEILGFYYFLRFLLEAKPSAKEIIDGEYF